MRNPAGKNPIGSHFNGVGGTNIRTPNQKHQLVEKEFRATHHGRMKSDHPIAAAASTTNCNRVDEEVEVNYDE